MQTNRNWLVVLGFVALVVLVLGAIAFPGVLWAQGYGYGHCGGGWHGLGMMGI